ncbi:MAG: outer membrane beta-barrel protein [Gemmatimonadales bacterium]|nr:outer membrane beta-barrel protein [Gemmatimonadales bacterium]
MERLSQVLSGLALTAVLGATPAMAQGAEFSLGGGLTLPLSDFGDVSNTGWHGLAAVSFAPSSFPLGIQIDGMYQRLGVEDFGGIDSDISTQIIQGTANVIYKFKTSEDSQFRPYLIGGPGVYNFKATGGDAGDGESSTDFGINAGAGFDVKLGSVGAFIEGRFHNVFTEGSDLNFIPITLGVRLGGN